MKTQDAYNQYMMYAAEQQAYYNSLVWVLFTFFVIAPIAMLIIYYSVVFYLHKKGRL